MTDRIDLRALRGKPRMKLFEPTELRTGSSATRAHLLNLSATGALVHTATPPAPGTTVHLRVGGTTRAARVVWAQGSRLGAAFRVPLPDHEVDALVSARHAHVAQASARVGVVAA